MADASPRDALAFLMQQHALTGADIAGIEVQIPQRGLKRIPTTRHASISALTVCAMAAAHGKLDFYRLHDPAGAMDAAALAMQQRVRFIGRDDWTDLRLQPTRNSCWCLLWGRP